MSSRRFPSVWNAIENTPQEAVSMRLRSEIIIELSSLIEESGLSHVKAAELFCVTEPRVSELMRGKVELFSLEDLVGMAAVWGHSIECYVGEIS